MAQQNRTTLKTYFETGDTPTQAQFIDLIDSEFNPSNDTLDAIPDGTTYKLVTAAEKTVLGNTSGTNTGDNATNSQYSGLVTNATHTGDATGATALSVVKIQGKDFPTLGAGDDQKYPKYVSASNAFVMTTVSGGGVTDHTALTSIGTNTHTQIDTHIALPMREVLAADRTYYIRTDGSDSNNGLTNTAGGAFLTVQKFINTVAGLDLSIYNVTGQMADGTYTGTILVNGPWMGAGTVTLQGNATTPANVLISTTTDSLKLQNKANLTIKDFKVTASTAYNACLYSDGGSLLLFSGIVFGSAQYHVFADNAGVCKATGNYTIAAGAQYHWVATNPGSGLRIISVTVTLTGTPNFSGCFALAQQLGGILCSSNTFAGAATGKRYDVFLNAMIQTGGAGANYLPGNVAGTTATGGQYA